MKIKRRCHERDYTLTFYLFYNKDDDIYKYKKKPGVDKGTK